MSVGAEAEAEVVQRSDLFDAMWYLQTYPDVAKLRMDPAEHYRTFGSRLGRDPSPRFSAGAYLAANPDVANALLNPLIHYELYGRGEGRILKPDHIVQPSLPRSSGTIIIVSHDAEVGGAQQVVLTFAEWLLSATKYDVKLVVMRGGLWSDRFQKTAPTFNVLAEAESRTPKELEEYLRAWAGADVKTVFMNSVASGGFLRHWHEKTPVVSFIHELPKIIAMYENEFRLILDRATTIVGGSDAVKDMLRRNHGLTEERLGRVYGFIESPSSASFNDFETKKAAKRALGLQETDFLVAASGVMHWRKSPDIFVEVADRVTKRLGSSAQFMWVGGGPDHERIEAMIAERGLQNVLRVTGHVADIAPYLNAADVFLLPSEEDPFPLACLYAAMACSPIVCFEDAGGMPELAGRGCGKAVPFKDVDAMVEATLHYASKPGERMRDGVLGQQIVSKELTIATTGPQLLEYIRRAAGLKPHVSVVVPNYNCAPYLEERLSSINRQTFQDFELILLDDKSTDASLPILREWVSRRAGTSLIANKKNSGSPFVQWLKGIDAAESDLIWIAESDDSCHPGLLESLVASFEDRNVRLGYVKSVPVDAPGNVLGNYEALYLNRIQPGRWGSSYVATDHEEANLGLGIANCIPNASSMMFRRFDPEPEFVRQLTTMRMCGDWYFYLRAMRGGLIAYNALPYNYHRRHSNTVTSRMEGSPKYFEEFAVVRAFVDTTYRQDDTSKSRVASFLAEDFARFQVTDPNILSASQISREKSIPSLLVVAPDLSPGGGQMFSISLANEWARRGGRVVLLNVGYQPTHPAVLQKVDRAVTLVQAGVPGTSLHEIVRRYDIDVIHSSIWWSDVTVEAQFLQLTEPPPWIITMHGCHESILDNPDIDREFPVRVRRMIERASAWVYTADKNLQVFDVHGKPERLLRVSNGMNDEPTRKRFKRTELGLRRDAMVLCLASRAIESKGWMEAVAITDRLNSEGSKVDLMLIGEGPAADVIREKAPDHVRLMGQVPNLQDYLALADVGLLPSSFVGESLPLVLIEMMAKGLPLIASRIGEIPALIGEGETAAGFLVPLSGGELDMGAFLEATRSMLDPDVRRRLGANARARYEAEFTLTQMVDRYAEIYKEVGARGS